MPLSHRWNTIFWSLAGLGGLWALFLGSLTHPWLQRNALYANKVHTAWWQRLDVPEKWGFLHNQVRPFNRSTPDGEILYGWHILPLDVYRHHEQELLNEPDQVLDYTDSVAYKVLSADPDSKVVINFHGNAGHVAQGWRTDSYRALSLGSQKVHVIAFDYRGFGYSTGTPSENGLITDGISVVNWVLDVLKVPSTRVAIVGQSLGTAVATAVAEEFATLKGTAFAGLVLIAPFSDLVTLLTTYSIGRVIPIFSPLAPYPFIQRWFESKVLDTWNTTGRLNSFVQASGQARVHLIHAKNDFDIHWSHSSMLFYAAVQGTSNEGLSVAQINSARKETSLGDEGTSYSWNAAIRADTLKRITYVLLQHGGHNRVTTYPILSKTVMEVFS